MEIPVDLSKHCIQTEIKRLYTKTIGLCFRQTFDIDETEEKIEILREALENIDFGNLRSNHKELCGGNSENRISIARDPAGKICININGNPIFP